MQKSKVKILKYLRYVDDSRNFLHMIPKPLFTFKVLKQHRSPLDRQLHEAVRISPHGGLNSKAEYRQNQIKRLSVQFTDRELKAVER